MGLGSLKCEQLADADQQFSCHYRFFQVVVCTQPEGLCNGFLITYRRNDNNTYMALFVIAADAAHHFQTVGIRHHQVGKHYIVRCIF